jgi:hypothetical protein
MRRGARFAKRRRKRSGAFPFLLPASHTVHIPATHPARHHHMSLALVEDVRELSVGIQLYVCSSSVCIAYIGIFERLRG